MPLNERQVKLLLLPMQGQRVGKDGKGFSHTEGWDIRRYLNRVFGFAGWTEEILSLELIAQRDIPNGKDRFKHYVVYRATVRLTLKDTAGNVLAFYDGSATGTGNNLPDLGDAHDMAIKTAETQALKRCAINLGDQFGLSLYNGGTTAPVVQWSMAYPPAEVDAPGPVVAPTEDAPVLAEPNPYAEEHNPDARTSEQDLHRASLYGPEEVAQQAERELDRRHRERQQGGYTRTPAGTSGAQYLDPPDDTQNHLPDPDDAREWSRWYARCLDQANNVGWADGLPNQFQKSYGVEIDDAEIWMLKDAIKNMGGQL